MKVTYKGIKQDLPSPLQEKLDAKFVKLSKLIDGDGEKRAHVIVTSERHLHKVEITVHTRDRELVGMGANTDLFNAVTGALEKIATQAVKQGAKFRSSTRRSEPMKAAVAKPAQERPAARPSVRAAVPAAKVPRVFRPNQHERHKPITLEEAVLQMEDGRDYLVYRDADKQSLFMLVRRRDGHFDLIES
jgi:putative sigma-54 modulation protein